jgi:hypothetical protein
MFMNKKRRLTGLFFMCLSSLFSLNNLVFTGAVIGIKGIPKTFNLILSIIFLIIGILIYFSDKRTLDKEVEGKSNGGIVEEIVFYDKANGSEKSPLAPELRYMMSDPIFVFGNEGIVTLKEFRRGLKDIEEDKDYLELVREEYGPLLIKSFKNGDKSSAIAERFLIELYGSKEEVQKVISQEDYLSRKERREIIEVFREAIHTRPTREQERVLQNYNFVWEKTGSGHVRIHPKDSKKYTVISSSTPGDLRGGLNFAHELLNNIAQYLRSKDLSS